ncbi:hypothetical protein ACIRSS_47410 [Amycolatopsis sp. NPDC101161]|uniref:hypothetical protein n=1 Tax=Amycolatopsis sp. NPDC101161 TaxID=3363940 RepID=UPI00381D93B1
MLTQVLESIEEEHIEVLVKIEEWPAGQLSEEATQEDKGSDDCNRDNLIASLPDLAPVVRMLLNSLESQQLIVNSAEDTGLSVSGGARYALTDLEQELMERLRDEYVRLRS